jgi:hypothetical protein
MKKFHLFSQNRVFYFFCLWAVTLQLFGAKVWGQKNNKIMPAVAAQPLAVFSKPAPIPPP